VTDNAALVFNRSDTVTFGGNVSGSGTLTQSGVSTGTLILTGANTYSGGTTISAGTLQIGNGGSTGSIVGDVIDNAALVFNRSGTPLTFAGAISGSGTLSQVGTNTLILTGTSTYTGATTVSAGTLQVDGVLGNTAVDVRGGTTLTGKGLIAGNVTIENNGRLAPGPGAETLGVGNLTLHSGSNLDYQLSTAGTIGGSGVNSLLNVTGNLTLAGSLNVTDGGGFGTGFYRLINYTGTLTNNTLGLGTLPVGFSSANVTVVTGVAGQVNLVVSPAGVPVQFWDGTTTVNDGTIHGDNGTWDNSATNFTNGAPLPAPNEAWQNGIAIFTATPGTVTLGADITYQGMTFSVDGYTVVGDVPGVFALHPTGMATITTDTGVTATIAAPIVGAGGLNKAGPGTLILSGTNTYADGTTISGGTLVAAASGALGLGSGIVQMFNGTLTILTGVTLSNEVMFVTGGVLNNAGTLNNNVLDGPQKTVTVVNFGTGIINGNVIIGGATDTVQLFTGSIINGNLALSGTTSSTLILDGAGQQLFSLAVTGTVTNNGSLVKQGSGTWTIDRALAAPLGTDILAGTLAVGAALTSPQVNISSGATLQLNSGGTVGSLVDNGSVIFAGSDTVARSGIISGQGNVIQNGPGTTILSGSNTYSGGTIINLGALLVNNAQALGTGNVTLNGGILGASGLQPINVLGNYTQNAGGILQLNISGRAPGQFDVLNVAGSALLNGTLQLNLGYQAQSGDKLVLVNTGGPISGRFAHFQNPFTVGPAFNTVDLVYARNSVTLEFLQTGSGGNISTTDFNSFALTPNQHAAARLLDAVQLDPRATNLIAYLAKVPFADLPHTFNQISPESLSALYEISFSNANIQRLNLESRMDDLHNGSNGFSSNMKVNGATVNTDDRSAGDGKTSKAVVEPILQPGPGNRWGVWMTGFGDFVSVDGDANANGYNFTTGGVSLGIDYRLTDELVVGVMAEYSHTWTSLKPSGSNDVNSGRGGLYATWSHHGFYLNGAIYGGYNSYNSSRSALQGLASGNTEGAELSTFISGGYDFHVGPLTVGPVAALQYTYANINGFSESGSLAPMQIQSGSANSLRSDVGFRLFYQWQVGKAIIEPSLKAAWEHEFLYSALPVTAGFANIPGPTATFTGPAEGHDSAIVSAGVSVIWTPTLTVYVNYDGQLGRGNYDSNAVTGGVRISF
jgi:outer membrane autotransporter protein